MNECICAGLVVYTYLPCATWYHVKFLPIAGPRSFLIYHNSLYRRRGVCSVF
jgi:hypothetical protein